MTGAMRCANRGHACFPPEQLGRILRKLRADVGRAQRRDGSLDILTCRERAVLMCLVEGRRKAKIADELGLSVNTVRTHTNKIFAKLGVHSRLEAVSVARSALRGTWPLPTGVAVAVSTQELPRRPPEPERSPARGVGGLPRMREDPVPP
ncbi:MAG: response regulator transcription factor [Pseudonocardiaceae bacterium]